MKVLRIFSLSLALLTSSLDALGPDYESIQEPISEIEQAPHQNLAKTFAYGALCLSIPLIPITGFYIYCEIGDYHCPANTSLVEFNKTHPCEHCSMESGTPVCTYGPDNCTDLAMSCVDSSGQDFQPTYGDRSCAPRAQTAFIGTATLTGGLAVFAIATYLYSQNYLLKGAVYFTITRET